METYIVNGVSVEYDTFDLENMTLFISEVERMSNFADSTKGKKYDDFSESVADLCEMCEEIKDFFDCVVGEGTADRVFGNCVTSMDSVLSMVMAYHNFVAEVSERINNISPGEAPVVPTSNREQRRAAAREQRRAEAKAKAEVKRHAE